jgi:enamine deaminase RidA (YjgF/YER057c/UK114 family)
MTTNADLEHPYSDAVIVGDLVFVSGCLPVDEEENLVEGPGALDAALGMVGRRLGSVGLGLDDVVKLTYYVTDIAFVPQILAVRDEFIDTSRPPASTVVQIAALYRPDLLLEVDAFAMLTAP